MSGVIDIVKEPHKVLRKKASVLSAHEIKSTWVQNLIAQMKETLKSTPDGVGLAAPQVREPLRIFIVSQEAEEIDKAEKEGWVRRHAKNGEYKKQERPYNEREWKYYVFINPVITNISKKKLKGPEGCLSVPGKFGTVLRHEKITIEACDEHGKKFSRGASRFFARVIQHELDHLNGMLFVDKATDLVEADKTKI